MVLDLRICAIPMVYCLWWGVHNWGGCNHFFGYSDRNFCVWFLVCVLEPFGFDVEVEARIPIFLCGDSVCDGEFSFCVCGSGDCLW